METADGVRILWKYTHKRTREVHYSWERWRSSDSREFYEKRFPPEEE
jgi:hypothetical protein